MNDVTVALKRIILELIGRDPHDPDYLNMSVGWYINMAHLYIHKVDVEKLRGHLSL